MVQERKEGVFLGPSLRKFRRYRYPWTSEIKRLSKEKIAPHLITFPAPRAHTAHSHNIHTSLSRCAPAANNSPWCLIQPQEKWPRRSLASILPRTSRRCSGSSNTPPHRARRSSGPRSLPRCSSCSRPTGSSCSLACTRSDSCGSLASILGSIP